MSPSAEIFQALVQDHSRRPRQVGRMESPPAYHGQAVNPACGDEVSLWIHPDTTEILFTGQGCAISQASASLLASKLRGRSLADLQTLQAAFLAHLQGHPTPTPLELLGDLQLFTQLQPFPARIACALVAWHALGQALRTHAGSTL